MAIVACKEKVGRGIARAPEPNCAQNISLKSGIASLTTSYVSTLERTKVAAHQDGTVTHRIRHQHVHKKCADYTLYVPVGVGLGWQ